MTYSLCAVRRVCSILFFSAQLLLASGLFLQTANGQSVHPLDPLTSDEIKAAAGVITALPQFPA
ncbi:MAG: hypothetical protein ND895_26305, partial [Pyrinomonadaceae bacterium]|nr:hypothetical protein [Pyrinomonadaceae bacterium]